MFLHFWDTWNAFLLLFVCFIVETQFDSISNLQNDKSWSPVRDILLPWVANLNFIWTLGISLLSFKFPCHAPRLLFSTKKNTIASSANKILKNAANSLYDVFKTLIKPWSHRKELLSFKNLIKVIYSAHRELPRTLVWRASHPIFKRGFDEWIWQGSSI